MLSGGVAGRAALTTLLAVAAVAAPASQTSAPQPSDFAALTARLSQAADNQRLADLRAARETALRIVATPVTGVSPALAHYTLAYADFRLAGFQGAALGEQQAFADEAEQHLRAAIKLDDRFADAHGLLSGVLGLKIGWAASIQAKVSMGPESAASLDRGLALEPNNPRLLIIRGSALFRRPVEFGGDPKQAEALFRRAAQALDAANHTPWPNWGGFDAHAWLGQALAKRGDAAGAREEYAKALAIAPASSWVKDVLLPAVAR